MTESRAPEPAPDLARDAVPDAAPDLVPGRREPWYRSSRARWAVPAVVAVVVAGAFAVPALASAGGNDLPDVTPAELLARVVQADGAPLSGTVVYTARLGLPDLPFATMSDAGPSSLLSGSSTVRVWTDGDQRSRIALLGATSEYSMVRNGLEAWTYSSAKNEVVHAAPSPEDAARLKALMGDGAAKATPGIADPEQLARMVLTMAQESSNVSMDADTTVAGRSAYQLVVTPKTAGTLVGHIVLAVDGATSVPLRLQVWSTKDAAAPALELGYTDISFGMPDAAALKFSVPVGAKVREVQIPVPDLASLAGLTGTALPKGLEGLKSLDGLKGLQNMDPAKIAELTGIDPAELQRIAGLPGPERIAAMQKLMSGLDLTALLGEAGAPDTGAATTQGATPAPSAPGEHAGDLRILGSGWGTVVEFSGVDLAAGKADAGTDPATGKADAAATPNPAATPGSATAEDLFAELDQSIAGMHDGGGDLKILDSLATKVPEGRLISSALLSILITDDGRVLVGAVPGDVLRKMA